MQTSVASKLEKAKGSHHGNVRSVRNDLAIMKMHSYSINSEPNILSG